MRKGRGFQGLRPARIADGHQIRKHLLRGSDDRRAFVVGEGEHIERELERLPACALGFAVRLEVGQADLLDDGG